MVQGGGLDIHNILSVQEVLIQRGLIIRIICLVIRTIKDVRINFSTDSESRRRGSRYWYCADNETLVKKLMALLVFQGPQTPPISFRYRSHIIQLSYSFSDSFARSANAKSIEIYINCERYKTLTNFSLSSIFLGSHKVLKPFLLTSPVDLIGLIHI